MAYLNDEAFDQGLDWVQTNGTRVDICSAEPANYAGIAAVTVGNDTVTTGAPSAGVTDGRRCVVPAITTGTVTDDAGSAAFWALSNGTDTLVATGALVSTQLVYTANGFTLEAFYVGLRDAAAV